jgi:hypothetical protein
MSRAEVERYLAAVHTALCNQFCTSPRYAIFAAHYATLTMTIDHLFEEEERANSAT